MLYQANFTEEMASKLWGMAVLYLHHTRNMTSTMANSGKLSPNTKFDNEDIIEIERMHPFCRMGLMTIGSQMKRKLSRRIYKASIFGIPKHYSRGCYYIYNIETKRMIISRDITWAPFVTPDFNNGLDEVLRPKMNDKNDEKPNMNIE